MQYYIKTLGCQMNENDSTLISSLLKKLGHIPCLNYQEADIIIINTCCIRESAETKALGFIGTIKSLKAANPKLIIAVCGCMSQNKETALILKEKHQHVGIIIGTFSTSLLPQYIEEYAVTGKRIIDIEERYENQEIGRVYADPPSEQSYKAQVNINFGCDNFCSYCIVPYVRGRERSRAAKEIIADITRLADLGVKEVQLLGQNVNSYGKDMPEQQWDFARLLCQINEIEGIERIRYMTSHPRDFDLRLAETIAGLDKVCHHFHLPIQSGCDRLLKLMNRGYSVKEYRAKLDLIRELMPDATITSDIIVGFPGETDEDFQETLDFLTSARFDAAYTFIYSRRSGTAAAQLPNHLDNKLKKERLQILMDLQNPISLAHNQKLLETSQEIMVDGISKTKADMMSGRTSGNKIVVFPYKNGLNPGDLVKIKITAAKTWSLSGILSDILA